MQKEKEMTENEMVGWHHRLKGHKFELAPGDGTEGVLGKLLTRGDCELKSE